MMVWFAASFDPMTDKIQRFYQAVAQLPKSAGSAVAKGKAEVEPKGAVASKRKDLLDGVKLMGQK
jgi:hypothetical protein